MQTNKMADERGSRLFADLNSCFRRDPMIDEYDFLPVPEPKQNKSPLIVVEHKLGIEAWCIRILYQYCYERLLNWRSKEGNAKFIHPQEVANLSRAVLLVQPDCYTAWNIRKDLVENGDVTVTDDLSLGALVLSKHPKSAETFTHRRWLMTKLLSQSLSSSNDSNSSNNSVDHHEGSVNMDSIGVNFLPSVEHHASNNHLFQLAMQRDIHCQLQEELNICSRAAEQYSCNYYAWSHRIWTLQHCFNCSLQVLLSELHSTQPWVTSHISDHSGFHYRQFLLKELLQQSASLQEKFCTNSQDLLDQELQLTLDLSTSYPGHEALWYHRKFVFHSLYHSLNKSIPKGSGRGNHMLEQNGVLRPSELEQPYSSSERQGQKKFKSENNEQQCLIIRELDSVSHKSMQNSNKYHQHLATRYKEWIQRSFSH